MVCGKHFLPTDYKWNSKRLRDDAVPSQNLPPIEGEGVQEPVDQEMEIDVYVLPSSDSEEEVLGGDSIIAIEDDSEEEEEDEDGGRADDWDGIVASDDESEDEGLETEWS